MQPFSSQDNASGPKTFLNICLNIWSKTWSTVKVQSISYAIYAYMTTPSGKHTESLQTPAKAKGKAKTT